MIQIMPRRRETTTSINAEEHQSLINGENSEEEDLVHRVSAQLAIGTKDATGSLPGTKYYLVGDLTYGIPREVKPRREKILAIAKQLVNFLDWQTAECHQYPVDQLAELVVVLKTTEGSTSTRDFVEEQDNVVAVELDQRMRELWTRRRKDQDFPSCVHFVLESLESWLENKTNEEETLGGNDIVYLSPDAETTLDFTATPESAPTGKTLIAQPPKIIIIGLLIDRRTIQTNRSLERASKLRKEILIRRWPIESVVKEMHQNEPLNVDCVLEGMQQWYWNCYCRKTERSAVANPCVTALYDAMYQALCHHQKRHPERTRHKV